MGPIGDTGAVLALPLALLLVAVAAIDLRRRIVPDRLLAPAAALAVGAGAGVDPAGQAGRLTFGALTFLVLLVIALLSRGGLGMGDVKLGGVMGLFLGPAVVPALVSAFTAGSLVGALIVVRHGVAARGRALPFAPFLALGGIVGLAAGEELLALYLGAAG